MVWRYSIATCWAEAMLRTSKTDTGRVSCKTLVSQSGPKSMPQPIYQKIVLKSNNFSNLKCPKTTIQYYRLVPNARCVTWFICGVNYLALVANPFDVSAPSCISSPWTAINITPTPSFFWWKFVTDFICFLHFLGLLIAILSPHTYTSFAHRSLKHNNNDSVTN